VPVAARIVRRLHRAARVALPGVAPHPSRATTDQLRQHTTLLVRRLRAPPRQVLARMDPEHLGYGEVGPSAAVGRGASGAGRVEPSGGVASWSTALAWPGDPADSARAGDPGKAPNRGH